MGPNAIALGEVCTQCSGQGQQPSTPGGCIGERSRHKSPVCALCTAQSGAAASAALLVPRAHISPPQSDAPGCLSHRDQIPVLANGVARPPSHPSTLACRSNEAAAFHHGRYGNAGAPAFSHSFNALRCFIDAYCPVSPLLRSGALPGANSTSTSTSLSGPKSPRRMEPNNRKLQIPCPL